MKSIELIENQAVIRDRSHQLYLKEPKLSGFETKNIPYLSNIPEIALADIMGQSKTIRYIKKAIIVPENTKTNSVIIIFSGKAWVFCAGDQKSNEVMFQIQEPHSGIGELAVLTNELRSASVITMEKTVFAAVKKNVFINWLMNYPEVKFTLLGMLT